MELVRMTGFCQIFDISGRKSEPEVENVMFDVQLMIIWGLILFINLFI